mmetsp:Transcript_38426/g.123546  ORF Transcript_38426/g.123546 Transcript_38426/m.123546 type:complete len:209 (-) Transcript_38426:101-727(-)
MSLQHNLRLLVFRPSTGLPCHSSHPHGEWQLRSPSAVPTRTNLWITPDLPRAPLGADNPPAVGGCVFAAERLCEEVARTAAGPGGAAAETGGGTEASASSFRPLAGSAASSDSESLTGAAMVLRGAAAPRLRRLVASSAAFALAAAFSLASALRFASSSAAFCLASFAARSAGAMESREAVAREGGARSGAQCQVPCGRPRAARPQAT